jgi:hypothetical protein
MFRLAVVCAVFVVTTVRGAPVPRESMRPPVPLADTVWEGDGVVAPTTYEFHASGWVSMSYQGQRHPNIGIWTQNGRDIYWESCNKYCEFQGTLTGTTITGHSWNKPGGNWTLTVKRTSVASEK